MKLDSELSDFSNLIKEIFQCDKRERAEMSKYKVYVNAGIEIWDEVEAENEEEAHKKAYELIKHRDYGCDIEVTKIESEPK